jgi:hypothetical protein
MSAHWNWFNKCQPHGSTSALRFSFILLAIVPFAGCTNYYVGGFADRPTIHAAQDDSIIDLRVLQIYDAGGLFPKGVQYTLLVNSLAEDDHRALKRLLAATPPDYYLHRDVHRGGSAYRINNTLTQRIEHLTDGEPNGLRRWLVSIEPLVVAVGEPYEDQSFHEVHDDQSFYIPPLFERRIMLIERKHWDVRVQRILIDNGRHRALDIQPAISLYDLLTTRPWSSMDTPPHSLKVPPQNQSGEP